MQLMTILALVFAIVSVLFALQNTLPVTVSLLVWEFDSPLAVVLLMALALGAFSMALLSTPAVLRQQWQGSKQNRRITRLEKENAELRAALVEWQSRESAVDRPLEGDLQRPYRGLRQLMFSDTASGAEANGAESSGNGSPPKG